MKSTTCMKAHVVLVILCGLVVAVVQSTFAASAAINPAKYCAPGQATNSRQCAARMKKCRAYGAILKFTGQGCRNSRGKPARDGGCQCSGYCAYSCSKPCVRDRQCYWNASASACFVKATKAIGAPILSCLPTHRPTTTQPSQQPAIQTAMPSTSPSKSPTTSEPSMSPSQAPSQSPSQTPSTTPTRGPVSVTCDLTVTDELTGIWLDGVDLLSSVTPSGELNLGNWSIPKQVTFDVDPTLTSQTLAVSGRAPVSGTWADVNGFTVICQSELLVWTFVSSGYENWEGVNGPTFPPNWQTGDGTSIRVIRSFAQYCLNIAPYSEECATSPTKYIIVKIWPDALNGNGDALQGIRKTIDSSTPNYMMRLGRMVLMPPTTGSTVILYSISNTKSFRITNLGTSGNLCIYNEPAGTVSRCYYGTPSSTLFYFAFRGSVAAGYDNTVYPAAPAIVGTALFTSVTPAGILYLRDDENLCYNNAGALPPTAATSCLLFSYT